MRRPKKLNKIGNAKKCKRYRERKDRDSYLQKEKERKQKKQQELKKDPILLEAMREKDRIRKQKAKQSALTTPAATQQPDQSSVTPTSSSTPASTSTLASAPSTPFSMNASLQRSAKRARIALPKSPRKKSSVIQHFMQNYHLPKNII